MKVCKIAQRSEEWGMHAMQSWLQKELDGTPAVFVDAKEPFYYL